MTALLAARNLVKQFPARQGGHVHAVSGLSLELQAGETLGLVGESGCGKSTTARCLLRLIEPTSGEVLFRGCNMFALGRRSMRRLRSDLQVVFQDPYGSLDPRMTVRSIVAETLRLRGTSGKAADQRVAELLERVGLRPEHATRYPHEFSSGQRQRISLARALAPRPAVLVLDEPVSALDVSIQAGVLNLLEELRAERDLAYLFISHDLAVVRHICDRVAVMYLGKIVEMGARGDVYEHSAHPYTQALLSAAPVPDPDLERRRLRIVLAGEPANPVHPPSGCRFRTRCWRAQARCAQEEPALVDRGHGHPVACHFAEELAVLS